MKSHLKHLITSILCVLGIVLLFSTALSETININIAIAGTLAGVLATNALLSFALWLNGVIDGNWKHMPKGTALAQTDNAEKIRDFYLFAYPEQYPNIYFIGQLYRDLYKVSNAPDTQRQSWITSYLSVFERIIDHIHAPLKDETWIHNVERTITHPNYTHAVAYLRNLLDDKEYNTLLNAVPDSSDTILTPVLRQHYKTITQIELELRKQKTTIQKREREEILKNAAQLNANEFKSLEALEPLPVEEDTAQPFVSLEDLISEPSPLEELKGDTEKY